MGTSGTLPTQTTQVLMKDLPKGLSEHLTLPLLTQNKHLALPYDLKLRMAMLNITPF